MPARDGPVDPAEVAFRTYGDQIYRFLLRRTQDHYDAEELTQRVFAEAAEKLSREQPRALSSWLFAVAERRFIDEVRRRAVARRAVRTLSEPRHPVDPFAGREVAAALREEIAALPEAQRIVVVRKVIQGDSFADIAADLSISVDACKMRLSRAVATLRSRLAARGIGPDVGE